MGVDYFLHVIHAAVAHFNGIAIEYFVKSCAGGKVSVQDLEEPFPYVCINTLAVGRVVPRNVASASFSFVKVATVLVKLQGVVVSSCVECILVGGCGGFELLLITGDVR